ncbi:hypothetical protein G6514_001168 [Epicoccum nigrum]|nr:hypothetical protein G6514_001168 [Epicoccum nigrum]
MAATYVKSLDGFTVQPEPLQPYTSQPSFAEFYSSSFPVFALSSQVSEYDLQQAAKVINDQARESLGFSDEELEEMGYPAAVSDPWQLHEPSPREAALWYLTNFDKRGSSTFEEPQWYPLGFIGIMFINWKETGVVLVFYDALAENSKHSLVSVVAFVVDPNKIGSSLISLRQGDDDIDNRRRFEEMH